MTCYLLRTRWGDCPKFDSRASRVGRSAVSFAQWIYHSDRRDELPALGRRLRRGQAGRHEGGLAARRVSVGRRQGRRCSVRSEVDLPPDRRLIAPRANGSSLRRESGTPLHRPEWPPRTTCARTVRRTAWSPRESYGRWPRSPSPGERRRPGCARRRNAGWPRTRSAPTPIPRRASPRQHRCTPCGNRPTPTSVSGSAAFRP